MSERYLDDLEFAAHDNAKKKGFNRAQELVDLLVERRHITNEEHVMLTTYVQLAKIALMHSELGEMTEAVRKGDFDNEGEEAADVIIRLADYAGNYGLSLHDEVEYKMSKNLDRPFMHGGKRA